jgi:hypothetical protein
MFLLFVIVAQLLLGTLYIYLGNPVLFTGGLLAAGVMGCTLFSFRRTVVILLMYVSLLPAAEYGSRTPFFHGVYFHLPILFVFMILLGIYLMGESLHSGRRPRLSWAGLDGWVLGLTGVTLLSAFRGLVLNPNLSIIRMETAFLLLYAIYFLYRVGLDFRGFSFLWRWFILAAILTSVVFVALAHSMGSLSGLFLSRVVTRQPHLALLGIPLLMSSMIMKRHWGQRLLSLGLLLPLLVMVFLSQQRGLWGGVLVTCFVLITLIYFRKERTWIRVLRFFILILLILCVIVGAVLVIDRFVEGSILLTLFSRMISMKSLSMDVSTQIRVSDIHRVVDAWDRSLWTRLVGTGLGASYESVDFARSYPYLIDNSYLFVLWKMGILGFLVLCGLLLSVLRKGMFLFFQTNEEEVRILIVGLVSGLMGLMVVALTNACLVQYRFIVVWALLFASIESLYRSYVDRQDNDSWVGG